MLKNKYSNLLFKTYLTGVKLVLTLCLSSLNVLAQTEQIDSLKNELKLHPTQDTARVRILNSLIYDLHTVDLEATQLLIKESEELINVLDFKDGKAQLLYYRSYIETMQSEYLKCIESNLEAIELYEITGNRRGISSCLTNIGIAYYFQANFSKAIDYFQKSIVIDKELNDLPAIGHSLDNIGNIFADWGNYEQALINYEEALFMRKENQDSVGLATSYNNIGAISVERGDYPKGLEYFNKAVTTHAKLNNGKDISGLFSNITLIYQYQNKYNKAQEYIDKTLEIARKYKNKRQIARALNISGNIYKEQLINDKALDLFNESLKISLEINEQSIVAENLNSIADTYVSIGKEDLALTNYIKALEINQAIGFLFGECFSYLGIAQVYVNSKQYKKALEYVLKGDKIALNLDLVDAQRDAKKLLSNIYESIGDYKNAFFNHQQYKILNDSLFNQKNIEKITQLEYEFRYQNELEQAKNKELKLKQTVETTNLNLEKSEQNYLRAIIIALLVAMLLGGIIFYMKFRNVKAKTQNILVEQKLLRSQMTPHFIFNSLSVLQGMVLNKEEKTSVLYLSKFSKLLRVILENSRDKVVKLSKELLAVENYLALHNLESKSFSYSIKLDESIDPNRFNIPPMLIQPFIENSIEHAFVNQIEDKLIEIEILHKNESLICTIKDNGIGIDSSTNKTNTTKNSLSTTITSERLTMISKEFKMNGSVKIEDRKKFND